MCDLISRQALCEYALNQKNKSVTPNDIMRFPSAQPEIVQCKDCNHWSRESICDGFCSEDCMRHDEDFYCGYAERRTDET